MHESSCRSSSIARNQEDNSPFGDLFVRSHHRVLDVDGVIPHAPEDEGLVQGTDDEDSIVVICKVGRN